MNIGRIDPEVSDCVGFKYLKIFAGFPAEVF